MTRQRTRAHTLRWRGAINNSDSKAHRHLREARASARLTSSSRWRRTARETRAISLTRTGSSTSSALGQDANASVVGERFKATYSAAARVVTAKANTTAAARVRREHCCPELTSYVRVSAASTCARLWQLAVANTGNSRTRAFVCACACMCAHVCARAHVMMSDVLAMGNALAAAAVMRWAGAAAVRADGVEAGGRECDSGLVVSATGVKVSISTAMTTNDSDHDVKVARWAACMGERACVRAREKMAVTPNGAQR